MEATAAEEGPMGPATESGASVAAAPAAAASAEAVDPNNDDRKPAAPEPEPMRAMPPQPHLMEEALPFILDRGFLGLDTRKCLSRVSRGCNASTRACVHSIAGDARVLTALDRFPHLHTLRLTMGKRSDEPWRLPKGYAALWGTPGGFLGRVPLLRCLEVEVERDKKPREKRKTKKQREKEEAERAAAAAAAAKAEADLDEEEEEGEGGEGNAVVIVLEGEKEGAAAGQEEGDEEGGGGGKKRKRKKKPSEAAAADDDGGGTNKQRASAGGSKSKGKGKAAAADAASSAALRPDEIEEPLLVLKGLRGLKHLSALRLEVRPPGKGVQAGLARVLSAELPPNLEDLTVIVPQVGRAAPPLLAALLASASTPAPGLADAPTGYQPLARLRALRVIGEGPAPLAPDDAGAGAVLGLLRALTRTRTPRLEEVALLGGLPSFSFSGADGEEGEEGVAVLSAASSPLARLVAPPDEAGAGAGAGSWWEAEAPRGLTVEIDDDASFEVLTALMAARHPMGMAMYAASALHFAPDQLPPACRGAMVHALRPAASATEKCQALRAVTAFCRMGGALPEPGLLGRLQEHVHAVVRGCLRHAAAADAAKVAAGGGGHDGGGAGGVGVVNVAAAQEQAQLTERVLLLLHAAGQAAERAGLESLGARVFDTAVTDLSIAGLALRALAQRAPAKAYRAGAEGLVPLLWMLSAMWRPDIGEVLARLGRMALLPEATWDAPFAGETAAEGTLRLLGLVLDRMDAFGPATRASLCRLLAAVPLEAVPEPERPLFVDALRASGLLGRMTALWLREHQPAILLGLATQEPSLPEFFADILLRRIPVDDPNNNNAPRAAGAAGAGAEAAKNSFTGFGRALTGLCATAQTTALQEAFPGREMTREDLEAGRAAFMGALLAPERAADLWRALAQDCARVGAVTLLEVLQHGGARGLLAAMGATETALIGRQIDALKVASQRPRLWARTLRPHFFGSPQEHLGDVLARLEAAIAFTSGGKLKGVRMALVEELVVALAGVEEAHQQQQQQGRDGAAASAAEAEAEGAEFPPALAARVDAVLGAMGREEAAARLDKVLEGCKLARHIINLAGTRSKQRWAAPRLRLVAAAFAALSRGPVGGFVALLSVDEAAERAWKEEAQQQRAKKAAAAKRKSGGGGSDPAAAAAAALFGHNRHDPLYVPRSSALAALLSIQGKGGGVAAAQQQPAASPSPCLLEHWMEALCGAKEPWLHLALARACRHPRAGQSVLQALVDLPRWVPGTNMGRLAKGLAMLLTPPAPLAPLTPEEEGDGGQEADDEEGDGAEATAAAAEDDDEEEEDDAGATGSEAAAAMDVDGAGSGKGGGDAGDEETAAVLPAALLACLTTAAAAGDRDGDDGAAALELEFRTEDRVPALVMALYRNPSAGARALFFAPAGGGGAGLLLPDAPARLVRMLLGLLTGGADATTDSATAMASPAATTATTSSSGGAISFATRSLAEVLASGGDAALTALIALASPQQLLEWRAWTAVRILAAARPAFVLPAVLDAAATGAPGLGSIVADALRSSEDFARACVEGHLPALLRFLVAVSAGKGRAGVGLTALDLVVSAAGAVADFAPRVQALVEAEAEGGDGQEEVGVGTATATATATASLRRLVEALAGDRRVHRDAAHRRLLDELAAVLPGGVGAAGGSGLGGIGSGDVDGGGAAGAAAASGRAGRARKRQRS